MRLFRKRRKNNKGFSLVEMICAIAILSLTSTAIGSAMVMTTKNYQRGNAEVDVQKEAQTTTNLIGDLLVDGHDVKKTDSTVNGITYTTKLEIICDGITYELNYDPDTGVINYTETKTGETAQTGILAENVSAFNVGDLSDFKVNRNVEIDLSVDKNGRSYDASYNTSPRNVSAFNYGSQKSAIIVCESEVVIEPGQSNFELPVEVYGNPTVDNFQWSAITTAGPNSEVGTYTDITRTTKGINIKLDPNAKGILTFTLMTADKKNVPGIGEVPLDTKTITIFVRRADRVTYTMTSTDHLKKDCVYRIEATVGSDHIAYFDKFIGKSFDDNYKNPRYVDFQVTATTNAKYTILNENTDEDRDTPYIEIKLDEDLPMGEKITVTMVSKHAAGTTGYNKENVHYADVTNVCEIKNAQQAIVQDSGIRRGNDNFTQFHHTIDVATVSSTFKSDSNYLNNGNNGRYMFRYRVKGTNANSPYYRLVDNGINNNKFNANETWPWKAGLAYEIDVILVGIDNADSATPTMWFPQDDQLLNELKTTYPNLQKGWTDEDAANEHACTTFAEYGGTLEIGAAIMKWKDASGNFIESIGSEANHNGFTVSTGSVNKHLEFDGINMMTSHYPHTSYCADFYVWVDGNGGAAGYWDKIKTENLSNYFVYEYSNTQFKLVEVKSLASGHDYKIVPKIKDTYMTVDSYTLNSVTYSGNIIVDENVIFELANPTTGQGCIYFKVN